MRKKSRKVLMSLYILIIMWVTLFSRTPGIVRIFKGPFWKIRMGYLYIALNILAHLIGFFDW